MPRIAENAARSNRARRDLRSEERERERNPFIDIYIPDEFSRRLLPRMRRASKIPGGAAGGRGAITPRHPQC